MCWLPVREMSARRWKLLRRSLPPTLAASRRWRSCSAAGTKISSVLQVENYSWVLMTDRSERLQANSSVHSRVGTLRPVKGRLVTNGLANAPAHGPCKHFADAVSMPVAQRARTNTVSQPFPFSNQEIKRKLPLYVVGNNRSLMIEPQICLRFGPGDYTRRQQGAHGWRLGCPDNSA